MKKSFKFLSLMLTMMVMSFAFSACGGDDDEPVKNIDDWYSECTSVTGGGLSPQECSQLQNFYNTDEDLMLGPAYVWRNIDRDQAIYYFDTQIRNFKNVYSSGVQGIVGNLTVVFALKNSAGKTIKTIKVNITSTGSSMS